MKLQLNKLFTLFMSLLVLMTVLPTTSQTVQAEENTDDVITTLGTYDEVFSQESEPNSNLRLLRSSGRATVGNRIAAVWLSDLDIQPSEGGRDYALITYLYVDGIPVFCIQPGVSFGTNTDYDPVSADAVQWENLNQDQKQQIWNIAYYGYHYNGHQTDAYYVATQIMIWEVITGRFGTPYVRTQAGVITGDLMNIDAEVAEIRSLMNSHNYGTNLPSFHNQTIKLGLNTPITLTDNNHRLFNYSIAGQDGIEASINGNQLTIQATSSPIIQQLYLT